MFPGIDTTSRNRRFYDTLWAGARLADPAGFNTWPLIEALLPASPRRLEVGPGLRPRLPIAGSHFLDISPPVISELSRGGGLAQSGTITALPYPDASFDLVCAFDIVEHVDDDALACAELARVLRPGGIFLCSVPLHPELWSGFDDFVGHVRRYDAETLLALLAANGLELLKSARYGMQPANSRLLDLGSWLLTHQRTPAMFCYNWLLLPLGLRFQKRLDFLPGLIDPASAGEVLLVCRSIDTN